MDERDCIGWWAAYTFFSSAQEEERFEFADALRDFIDLGEQLAAAAEDVGLDSSVLIRLLHQAQDIYYNVAQHLPQDDQDAVRFPVADPPLRVWMDRLRFRLRNKNAVTDPDLSPISVPLPILPSPTDSAPAPSPSPAVSIPTASSEPPVPAPDEAPPLAPPSPPPSSATPTPSEPPIDPKPSVVLNGLHNEVIVNEKVKNPLNQPRYKVIEALLAVWPNSLNKDELVARSGCGDARGILTRMTLDDPDWRAVIIKAGAKGMGYRLL